MMDTRQAVGRAICCQGQSCIVKGLNGDHECGSSGFLVEADAAIAAHLKALADAGYAVVPREPTPEMVGAFWRVKNTGSTEPGETGDDRSDYAAYRAMIAASPGGGI